MYQNDYYNCGGCGDFSAPVALDGSEWCPKCGYERVNMVVGDAPIVPPDEQQHTSIQRQQPNRSMFPTFSNRGLDRVRKDFMNLTSLNGIPSSVAEAAFEVFTQINSKKETRGGVQQALLANCTYRAAINANIPRSCKVIKSIFGVTSKKFNEAEKYYAMFADTPNKSNDFDMSKNYGISGCVYRHSPFVQDSKLCHKAINVLTDILTKTIELHGKSPEKLAAAALLVVHHDSQKSLCKECDGKNVIGCSSCIKFACENFNVAKQTLLSHCRTIQELSSKVDAVASDDILSAF